MRRQVQYDRIPHKKGDAQRISLNALMPNIALVKTYESSKSTDMADGHSGIALVGGKSSS